MTFSKAYTMDLSSIMKIIADAQIYMASQNINQWIDGYPSEELILNDIANNESYIVKNEQNIIVGTAMFTTKLEQTYNTIDGKWLTADDAKYGVIHRIAVGANYRGKGIAKFISSESEKLLIKNNIASMRIDTHEDNKGMQSLLKGLDYTYCGIIYLEDGDKRLAYEKILIE